MDWWMVIVVAAIVVVGARTLRARGKHSATGGNSVESGPAANFRQDREDDRVSRLSAEDQAWEAASLQRARDAQRQDESAVGPHTNSA